MSGRSYVQHGRRHRPGGSDPISGLAIDWAHIGLDTDSAPDGTYYPSWLEDGFYTSNPSLYSYDDGATTTGNHPGIRVAEAGLYAQFSNVPLGNLAGDHSADSVHIENAFVDGGSLDDFLGLAFGILDQFGIVSSGSSSWHPHIFTPVNLRPGDAPATLTLFVEQHTGSPIPAFPRMFVFRVGEALDTVTPIPAFT